MGWASGRFPEGEHTNEVGLPRQPQLLRERRRRGLPQRAIQFQRRQVAPRGDVGTPMQKRLEPQLRIVPKQRVKMGGRLIALLQPLERPLRGAGRSRRVAMGEQRNRLVDQSFGERLSD